MNGPKAPPGQYKVRLVRGTDTLITDFNILKDPRTSSSQEDIRMQFKFVQEIVDKVSEAHETIEAIRTIRGQTRDFTERLDKSDDGLKRIFELGSRIDSLLTDIEENLYQTKNRSPQDPLNFPIRLTNKLAHLNSVSRSGDYPPTEQAIQVKEALVKEINSEINKFNNIMTREVKAFNEEVMSQNIDVIQLPADRE